MSAVREILDDAFLVAAVMHGTEVAKIKRLGRHVPLELRDALRIRDRFRCTTPGCTNWARLEMDHITPYARGGETSYDNLDHLCDTCHKQKTRRRPPLRRHRIGDGRNLRKISVDLSIRVEAVRPDGEGRTGRPRNQGAFR